MIKAMQFFPGISFAQTIVNSSQGIPSPKLIARIRPRAIGLRTVTPYSISGNVRSSIYRALPVTFSGPSFRCTDFPTKRVSIFGLIADLIALLFPRSKSFQSLLAHQRDHGDRPVGAGPCCLLVNEGVGKANFGGILRGVGKIDAHGPSPINGPQTHRARFAGCVELTVFQFEIR